MKYCLRFWGSQIGHLVDSVPPWLHMSGSTSTRNSLQVSQQAHILHLTYGHLLRIPSLEDAYILKFYCTNKRLMPEMYPVLNFFICSSFPHRLWETLRFYKALKLFAVPVKEHACRTWSSLRLFSPCRCLGFDSVLSTEMVTIQPLANSGSS